MESHIISEGLKQSEKAHGVRYMRLIGDGDSSVMSTIWQFVPYEPLCRRYCVPTMHVNVTGPTSRSYDLTIMNSANEVH